MLKGAAMYDLFGDKFDLNHDGRLSAAEHMMDFSVFNYWATDDDDGADRDRSSESYFDDDNDLDNCDSDDCDDDIGDDFEDDDEEDGLW